MKQSKLLNSVSKIGEEVKNSIGDIKEKVKNKGSIIIEGLKSGFDERWNNFKTTISGLGEKIKNALPDLRSIGKNAIDGFAKGFYSLKLKLPHIEVSWNKLIIFPWSVSVRRDLRQSYR